MTDDAWRLARWWRQLDDPRLDKLIEEALADQDDTVQRRLTGSQDVSSMTIALKNGADDSAAMGKSASETPVSGVGLTIVAPTKARAEPGGRHG